MSNTSIPNLLTVQQFIAKHSAFRLGGIRKRIFDRATNGFDDYKVIYKDGSRVLIEEDNFFSWLKNRNEIIDKIHSTRRCFKKVKEIDRLMSLANFNDNTTFEDYDTGYASRSYMS